MGIALRAGGPQLLLRPHPLSSISEYPLPPDLHIGMSSAITPVRPLFCFHSALNMFISVAVFYCTSFSVLTSGNYATHHNSWNIFVYRSAFATLFSQAKFRGAPRAEPRTAKLTWHSFSL